MVVRAQPIKPHGAQRNQNTIVKASANNFSSASHQQGLTMSASGTQMKNYKATLDTAYGSSNAQQINRTSHNPVVMSAAGSGTNTSSWGKIKSFGSGLVAGSHGQQMSNMRNASTVKMSAIKNG